MGSLTRTYSCKRPALVTTTFSNSRVGRLRELGLEIKKPSATITNTGVYHNKKTSTIQNIRAEHVDIKAF